MILPTKHIPEDQALLGVGATLLSHIAQETTISQLWERARRHSNVGTYERFILALDLLYLIGAIDLTEGLIARRSRD